MDKAIRKTAGDPAEKESAENNTDGDLGSSDDSVRRSSRKRTTSKWLEGMQTAFGKPKIRKCSESKEGGTLTTSPKTVKIIKNIPPGTRPARRKVDIERASETDSAACKPISRKFGAMSKVNPPKLSKEASKDCDDLQLMQRAVSRIREKKAKSVPVRAYFEKDVSSTSSAAGVTESAPDSKDVQESSELSDFDSQIIEYFTSNSAELCKNDSDESKSLVFSKGNESGEVMDCPHKTTPHSPQNIVDAKANLSDGEAHVDTLVEGNPSVETTIIFGSINPEVGALPSSGHELLPNQSSRTATLGSVPVEAMDTENLEESKTGSEHLAQSEDGGEGKTVCVEIICENTNDTSAAELESRALINSFFANQTLITPAVSEVPSIENSGLTILTAAAKAGNHLSCNSSGETQTIDATAGLARTQCQEGIGTSVDVMFMKADSEEVLRPNEVQVKPVVELGTDAVTQPEMTSHIITANEADVGKQTAQANQEVDAADQDREGTFIETVSLDDLPEDVISAIKAYTFTFGQDNEGIPDSAVSVGEKKFRVFKLCKGENSADRVQIDPSSASVIYDKGGNAIKLASKFTQLSQSSESLLKCPHCEYITDKRANWYKHKRKHESTRRYQCEVCDYEASTSSNLKRHWNTHSHVRQFACTVPGCTNRFKQKIHLERHIKYKHMHKQVKCPLCDYVCALENPDLKIHLRRKHSNNREKKVVLPKVIKVYACAECTFETTSQKDLKQHLKFHRKGPELKLFCEQCSFVTECQSRLNRHMVVHTKEKPFKCGSCAYRASQKEHVIRHMRTQHKLDVHKIGQVVMKPLNEGTDPGSEAPVDEHSTGNQVIKEEAREIEDPSANDCVTYKENGGEEILEEMPSVEDNGPLTISCDDNGEMCVDLEVKDNELGILKLEEALIMGHTNVATQTSEVAAMMTESKAEVIIEGLETETETLGESASRQISIVSCSLVDDGNIVSPDVDRPAAPITVDKLLKVQGKPESTITRKKTYRKKKYPMADFSNMPKIFNCEYCSMKFAKLINLYKHIHVQHASIHPVPTDGSLTCVICEFRTHQKKALLLHMRRHYPENDQEEASNVIFSCVLCQYCTPKRRNLYWHLKKKHKISLVVNKDGTAKCVVDEDGPVSVVSTAAKDGAVDMDGQQVALSVEGRTGSTTQKVVNVSDLAHSLLQPKVLPSSDDASVQVLMHNASKIEEVVIPEDEDAAVAIEGLQALAEQSAQTQAEVVLPSQGDVFIPSSTEVAHTSQTEVVLPSQTGLVLSSQSQAEVVLASQTERVLPSQTEGVLPSEGVVVFREEPEQKSGSSDLQSIELSTEQVMQLSLASGDYVEINGEMYKVELAPEGQSEKGVAMKTELA